MSYQFIDGNSSVLTADSSIISGSGTSGVQRPIVQIGSVLTTTPTFVTNSPNIGSVLSTISASIIGAVPVTGTIGSSVIGSVPVTGTIGASVVGLPPVKIQDSAGNNISSLDWSADGDSTANRGMVVSAGLKVFNGTNWDRLRGNSSIGALVNTGSGSVLSTQSGTWNINAAGSISGVSSVGGTTLENPVNTGGKAVNAEQGAVGNGAKVQAVFDLVGRQIIIPYANKENFVSGVTSVITSTSLTSVLSAAGSSTKNYVTHILVTNGSATGTFVDVVDGGGNVLYSGYAAASGGGFSTTFPVPLVGSANVSVDVKARAQASIIAAMTGYKGS